MAYASPSASTEATNSVVRLQRPSAPPQQPQIASHHTAKLGITPEELAVHCTRDDCWLAIDGTVYDATDFVDLHPGGEVLLAHAGRYGYSNFLW